MKKKGFTLLEIMIVIIIVGVLAALALPRMSIAIERARLAEGIAMAGSMRRLQHYYYHEHGKYVGPQPEECSQVANYPELGWAYSHSDHFYNIRTCSFSNYHGSPLLGELYRRPNPDYNYHLHIREDKIRCSALDTTICKKLGMKVDTW
jgi:prepilin-type N-terminal cleavage/methylation domain-containing protein